MKKTLVRGGTIIDPIREISESKDLLIEDGIFIDPRKTDENTEIINAKDHFIIPGLFDLRCHLKQPGISLQESVNIISRQAISGGFTSVLAMPNLSSMADNPEALKFTKNSIIKDEHVNIYLSGCLTLNAQGKNLAPIGSLKETGILAVTDCPNCTQDNQIFSKAAEYASMFSLPIIELARDYSLSPDASAHESLLSLRMGLKGYPRVAEELFVARSILLSKYTEANIHLTSITSKGSVDLIEKAKNDGVNISCDTTSNHLYCTERQIENFDPLAKPLPPFREKEDQLILLDAVVRGVVDVVCTGHQPYSFDDKSKEFDIAPPGTLGLENGFLQLYAKLNLNIDEKLILITRVMSKNPARLLNIKPTTFEINSEANFFIFDPYGETTIERNINQLGRVNLPYETKKLEGRIRQTILKGKIAR